MVIFYMSTLVIFYPIFQYDKCICMKRELPCKQGNIQTIKALKSKYFFHNVYVSDVKWIIIIGSIYINIIAKYFAQQLIIALNCHCCYNGENNYKKGYIWPSFFLCPRSHNMPSVLFLVVSEFKVSCYVVSPLVCCVLSIHIWKGAESQVWYHQT